VRIAEFHNLKFVMGEERDVLMRLIQGARSARATDVFRVTSECPFVHYEFVDELWFEQVEGNYDCVFLDDAVQGCGFELIRLAALEKAHACGDERHRSELCSLFIRENPTEFKIRRRRVPEPFIRRDLRLTVDYPEDLVVCRKVYQHFKGMAPKIPVEQVIKFLDQNVELKKLIAPYTEEGYSSMYLRKETKAPDVNN